MTMCGPDEKISLLQAALWVVRELHPEPEISFQKAPIDLSSEEQAPTGQLRLLFRALANDQLSSVANVTIIHPDDKRHEVVPVEVGRVEVPAHAWQFRAVQWNHSRLEILDSWDFPPEVDAKLNLSGDWLAWGGRAFWQPVLLSWGAVSNHFPPKAMATANAPIPPRRNPGGSPEKYDWPAFYAAAAVMVHDRGLPKTQAEFCDIMAEWCHQSWGDDVPSATTMKTRAGNFFKTVKRKVDN